MKRRTFMTLLGAAAAWPLAARAQQPVMPVIGWLGGGTAASQRAWVDAFVRRLGELGWIEGRTVVINYRWAEGRTERYAEIAAEFVRLKVDAIVTVGGAVAAAKQATATIPIVFAAAGDPVGSGMVASLGQPGGNVTGLSAQSTDLAGKRVEILREIFPDVRRLAIIGNVEYSATVLEMGEAQAAARTLGLEGRQIRNSASRGYRACLRGAQGRGAGAVCVSRCDDKCQPRSHLHLGARCATADDARSSGVRRSGRPDVLWTEHPRPLPARSRLRRQDSTWGQTRRPTGRATDQVRFGYQPRHGAGARHRGAGDAARRADKVIE